MIEAGLEMTGGRCVCGGGSTFACETTDGETNLSSGGVDLFTQQVSGRLLE